MFAAKNDEVEDELEPDQFAKDLFSELDVDKNGECDL